MESFCSSDATHPPALAAADPPRARAALAWSDEPCAARRAMPAGEAGGSHSEQGDLPAAAPSLPVRPFYTPPPLSSGRWRVTAWPASVATPSASSEAAAGPTAATTGSVCESVVSLELETAKGSHRPGGREAAGQQAGSSCAGFRLLPGGAVAAMQEFLEHVLLESEAQEEALRGSVGGVVGDEDAAQLMASTALVRPYLIAELNA